MKKLFLLILLSGSIAYAGTPAPTRIDTISSSGNIHFIASWFISLSTTPDTLVPPWKGTEVEIVHKGAASGDTIQASYAQSPRVASYSEWLTALNDVTVRKWSDASILRVIVKGSGTINAWIKIIR